jgi:selenocysteine-specific elongation factor
MRRLILGTAGHIDHGKTALVRALTGVDTDRLKEEKARGITIELGFAEFVIDDDLHFGVVDVPGHEGFIRNMLAGATGMDVVLLIVAADEGVMPQTREHVDIVRMLGVEQMVVALTKTDLVDPEWLALAREDVGDFLSDTPYSDAPVVATSATSASGLEELGSVLAQAAERAGPRVTDDLVRLPVDRVFTVKGTGTVVTGTLWSGVLKDGDAVRLLPAGPQGRVRGVQVHGAEADQAAAGQRTAVALAGAGLKREDVERGLTMVSSDAWQETSMLTTRLSVLASSVWEVRHGQRVRVHLGTAEVMARVALLEDETLLPGSVGWAQLRLEKPVVARGRDRVVIRSYSPVTTIGGGMVAEPQPAKRKHLSATDRAGLEALLEGEDDAAISAALRLRGWEGATPERLQVLSGFRLDRVQEAVESIMGQGGRRWSGAVFSPDIVASGRRALLERLDVFHGAEPLRPGFPLQQLRQVIPGADPRIVDGLLSDMEADGDVLMAEGLARRADFTPDIGERERVMMKKLQAVYDAAGMAPPAVTELPEVGAGDDLWPLLKLLEAEGALVALSDEFFVPALALNEAIDAVRQHLGGKTEVGPGDFREHIPVTRKHLIPILGYFDREGITVRSGEGRSVLPG